MKIRIATRKSALALAQTRMMGAELRRIDPSVEIEEVHVVTEGDRRDTGSLAKFGGKGLFVSEVEAQLEAGHADIAVHSMKDVPAKLAPGLIIACVPPREDPRDAFITKNGEDIDDLTAGSRIGTSSLRRTAQLRAFRNDLAYVLLRGNVDTRLRKLDEGGYDAIVLAMAGLKRLGLADRPLVALSTEISIPSVGQGALAIEAREDDHAVRALLAKLEDEPSRIAIEAERAFMELIEGGCHAPIAAHARFEDGGARIRFDAMVGSAVGDEMLRAGTDHWIKGDDFEAKCAEAVRIGKNTARKMLEQGAGRLLEEARRVAEKGSDAN